MGNMSSHYKFDYFSNKLIPDENHLEGDVWTHTCLVFSSFIKLMEYKYTIDVLDVYKCVSMLCHDLGKPFTRDDSGEKVTFYSHPFASIQPTVEFINYLKNRGYYIGEYPYYYILNPISNHIDFLRSDYKKHILYSNYDISLLYINTNLCYHDSKGRITAKDKEGNINNIMNTIRYVSNSKYPQPHTKNYNCCFIFLCGTPASGKNWYIDNYLPNVPSVSYDDIRMDIYYENFPSSGNKKEDYINAYKYCTHNKIDINSYLNKYIKDYIEDGHKTIVINNTNLTKKRRRSLINLLGKNNYFKAIYIVRDENSIINSNKNREDKNLPDDVVNHFIYKQPIPTMEEGFDEIEFFDNYNRS